MKLQNVTCLQINEHFEVRTASITDLAEAIKFVSHSLTGSDPCAAKVLLAIARQMDREMMADSILLAQIRAMLLCLPETKLLEVPTEITLLTRNF